VLEDLVAAAGTAATEPAPEPETPTPPPQARDMDRHVIDDLIQRADSEHKDPKE